FINFIEQITYQNWHINITIVIQDFFELTIALIDSGAQMNCIQEGLIPTKFFKKAKQRLSTANAQHQHLSPNQAKAQLFLTKRKILRPKTYKVQYLNWTWVVTNKNSEIERGTPRLVINYKSLNTALQWI
ncbi:LOW QUALITY PROTEIN: hypothetical protein CFOL_v3_10711, partial [Cephalotus follicularis]